MAADRKRPDNDGCAGAKKSDHGEDAQDSISLGADRIAKRTHQTVSAKNKDLTLLLLLSFNSMSFRQDAVGVFGIYVMVNGDVPTF